MTPIVLTKAPSEQSWKHLGSWAGEGGSVVVSGFWDGGHAGRIRVYDTAVRRLNLMLVTGQNRSWTPVGEMPSGDIVLVSRADPGPIRGILEPKEGGQIREILDLSAFVRTPVAYSAWFGSPKAGDGKTGFCSQADAVTVFSLINGSDHHVLDVPGVKRVLAVCSNTKRLAVVCAGTTDTTENAFEEFGATELRILNYESGIVESTLAAPEEGRFASAGFGPDGKTLFFLVMGTKSHAVFLSKTVGSEWSTEKVPLQKEMCARRCAFTPDSKHLVCAAVKVATEQAFLMLLPVEHVQIRRQVWIRGCEDVQELLFSGSNRDLYLIDGDGSLLQIPGFGQDDLSPKK